MSLENTTQEKKREIDYCKEAIQSGDLNLNNQSDYKREQTEEHKQLPEHTAVFDYVNTVPEKKEPMMPISRPTVDAVSTHENQKTSTREQQEVVSFKLPQTENSSGQGEIMQEENTELTSFELPVPACGQEKTPQTREQQEVTVVRLEVINDMIQYEQQQQEVVSFNMPKTENSLSETDTIVKEKNTEYEVPMLMEPNKAKIKKERSTPRVTKSCKAYMEEQWKAVVRKTKKVVSNKIHSIVSLRPPAAQSHQDTKPWDTSIGNAPGSELDSSDDSEKHEREQTTVTMVMPKVSNDMIQYEQQQQEVVSFKLPQTENSLSGQVEIM